MAGEDRVDCFQTANMKDVPSARSRRFLDSTAMGGFARAGTDRERLPLTAPGECRTAMASPVQQVEHDLRPAASDDRTVNGSIAFSTS
jgi:hypothetical protein